jgi:mannose-6-phosphate isomerase
MTNLYPLTFEPILKDYIWGGRNLERLFGRKLPPATDIAESWEIAAHPDGTATVNNGVFAGMSLTELHTQLGLDLIGTRNQWAQDRNKFPLLIKLLDANRPLSVQVHPRDEYALAHEGNELGKTEMWVILHAEPDAAIILGVQSGTTPEAFEQAIVDGNLEPYLHYLQVKTGDFVCVPAGSLHAILEGIVIAEIQQNSNTTYRVYDWNRVGHDGKPRPLHVAKALDVTNFAQVEPTLQAPTLVAIENGVTRQCLCSNSYFNVERMSMAAGSIYHGNCDGSTFEIWGTIEGEVMVTSALLSTSSAENHTVDLPRVRFTLLPAAMGAFSVNAATDSVLLRAFVS